MTTGEGSRIVVDHAADAHLVTEHLIGHGHVRIGHVGAPARLSRTVPFRTGYEQALAEAGMPGDERLVVHASSFSMPAGAKAAMQLLQQDDPPTAIMCADDTLAFGVISAVRELGLRVPDDLAVMGYCELPFASRRYAARHRGDSSRPTRLRGGPNPPQGDRRG